MRLFDEVAIVTDERLVESAHALRGVLEGYRLQVQLHRLVQREQAVALFAGGGPACDWTILLSHGSSEAGRSGLRFSVVGNDSGDPQAVDGWYPTVLDLTPQTIPELVTNARGTYISAACGGGDPDVAAAFLDAGCDAYVGCPSSYVDTGATVLFIAALFYFLLAEDRDLAPRDYSLTDAVSQASRIDPGWEHGTEGFVCFT